jgi:hypothetical protein
MCNADTPKEPTYSRNYWKLIKALRQHSRSTHHLDVLKEWNHLKFWECNHIGECQCGKAGIVEHNSIVHRESQHLIEPIGSSCIGYFPDEVQMQFKEARDEYLYKKKIRIANTPVGWGTYAHKTFYQLAKDDPQYAQWLLNIPKYTSKPSHQLFHPDHKEIRRLLKMGIEQGST